MTAKTKENLSVAARVCVALMILLLIILNYDRLTHIDMRALVDLAPNFAAAVFMLLGVYFVKSVLFVIPASLIYVSIGMAFDWPTACLINMGGILLEVSPPICWAVFSVGTEWNSSCAKRRAVKSY